MYYLMGFSADFDCATRTVGCPDGDFRDVSFVMIFLLKQLKFLVESLWQLQFLHQTVDRCDAAAGSAASFF